MQCPTCNAELTGEKIKAIEINRCPSCSGMWLDKGELNKLTDKNKQMVEYNTVEYDSGIHADKYPRRNCPQCGKAMKKVDLLKDTPIIYDFCPDCRGFWLDKNELKETKAYLEKRKQRDTEFDNPFFAYLRIFTEEPNLF